MWVTVFIVFLWDTWEHGGGEEVNVRARTAGSFLAGRYTFSNSPIFHVICYILSSGSFAASCLKTIANGIPRSSMPWTDTDTIEVSTT
jgi:hypothetical protein